MDGSASVPDLTREVFAVGYTDVGRESSRCKFINGKASVNDTSTAILITYMVAGT